MKNLHLIPTEKPSKLLRTKTGNELLLFNEVTGNVPPIGQNQHVYSKENKISHSDLFRFKRKK